jgi:hypothetical protein
MTEAELQAKFFDCARLALDRNTAQAALSDIERLETLSDIRPLCETLRS